MVPFSHRVCLGIGFYILFMWTASGFWEGVYAKPFPPDSHRLSVPFFPSHEGDCGPAALTSVFHFWGDRIDPLEVRQALFIPKLGGTLGMDMVRFARERGFEAKPFSANLSEIRDLIRQGFPLVAFLNHGTSWFPRGHFLVVTGYDDREGVLLGHTGMRQDHPISYEDFLKDWKKTNFWTLLIKSVPGERDPS